MNATLTPAAEKFIRRMLRFSAGPQAGFRLSVAPGGCSGYAAEFDVEQVPQPGFTVWEQNGLRIHLDARSVTLLEGSTINFVESISHTGFVFSVPGTSESTCSPSGQPSLVTLGMPTRL